MKVKVVKTEKNYDPETRACELIRKIQFEGDLLACARYLQEFVKEASQANNKKLILKNLYESIAATSACSCINAVLGSEKYCVLKENYATNTYLKIMLPHMSAPAKTLKDIELFAQSLLNDFSKATQKTIGVEEINKVMKYLDDEFNFSEKIFKGKIARFIILDVTHKDADSFYCALNDNASCFILLANRETSNHIDPVTVLLHELAHAMHMHATNSLDVLPDKIADALAETCFPAIKTMPRWEATEILANVLSIGLMHDSPLEKYDYFDEIHPSDKKLFALMAKYVLSN